MTYNELKDEVCALGFDTNTENSDILLSAVKRAVGTIYSERGVYKTLELYRPQNTVLSRTDVYFHTGGSVRNFETDAKAYSFKVSGNGSFSLTDALGTTTSEISADCSVFRGFIVGGGTLSFSGEYSYTVYDLAFFGDIFGGAISDIPLLGSYHEYRMQDIVADFAAFASFASDASGEPITGASTLGDTLKIPEDHFGKIIITYKSKPLPVTGNLDEVIPLPTGCEHLCPLLVAAYVWLDDDPEKAQYYMSLYREGMASVKVYSRTSVGGTYNDVTGWA